MRGAVSLVFIRACAECGRALNLLTPQYRSEKTPQRLREVRDSGQPSIISRTTFDNRRFVPKPSGIALLVFPSGVMNVITAVITAQRPTTMKYFTIDAENNITVHANRQAARDTGAGVLSTEVQFADLIGPNNQRLIEIWNSLPGVTPVKKFTNRKIATERIWKAIQSLGGPAAAPAPEPQAVAAIAAAEPVAQPPQPEPAPESVAPPAASEPSIPAAEQQPEPAAASQEQEPSVAPAEAAQQNTPFDEPVATVGAEAPDVAPVEAKTSKKASRGKKAPTGETNASTPREGSK